MKIKMLSTEYDNETNMLVWNKGDIFTVDLKRSFPSEYLIFTNIMGMDYGASTDSEGTKYEVVEE